MPSSQTRPTLPWESAPEKILDQGIVWRFDRPRMEQIFDWLGPLERGLFAFDMLCTGLFADADAPFVARLREAAEAVMDLLPSDDSPFSRPALVMSPAELIATVRRLSAAGSSSVPDAYRVGALIELAAAPDEGGSREAIAELTRTLAMRLHLAKCTTWASVIEAVLLRVVGHRRAGVDLVEMAGDLSHFANAHDQVAAAIAASNQPPIVELYLRARSLGMKRSGDDVTAVIADLRAWLGERLGGADLDAAQSIPGEERVGASAPLTDREAADLAYVALAGRELTAGATQLDIAPQLEIGLRRPLWRYAARVRLASLVGRTLADPPVETIEREHNNALNMFGVDFAVSQQMMGLLTRAHPWWHKMMSSYHWSLDNFPDSRDAWSCYAYGLLRRENEAAEAQDALAEIAARVQSQLTG